MLDLVGYLLGFMFVVGVLGACFFKVFGYRLSELRRWNFNAIVLMVIVATIVFVGITVVSLSGLAGESRTLDIIWLVTGIIASMPFLLVNTLGFFVYRRRPQE